MALSDGKLQKFFSNQKVGTFDALKLKGKVQSIAPKSGAQSQEIEAIRVREPSVSYSLAIREQTVSNPLAIREQSVSTSLAIRKQTVSNPLADPLANQDATASEKSDFNSNTELQLSTYSKKERELLDLIFGHCHNHCSLISPIISTEEIQNTLKISAERVRNLVFRISKKGGLTSKMSKSGQNACRIFELSKPLYQSMLENHQKNALNISNPLADPLAINPSSSSININTTTGLSDDWKNINIEPLKQIGFSETQLMQLQNKTTADLVQESIYHFAYGIENNSKFKSYTDPLNVLMGVLRKGGAWFEKDYKSPQEIAMQQLIEGKKLQQEREQRLKEELVKLEFDEWLSKLTDEEKAKISSNFMIPSQLKNSREAVIRAKFFEHFKKFVIEDKY